MIVPALATSSFVPDAAIIAMAFGLGACVGSFLNVVIWRLPRRCLSLVKPGSHCPICKTPIKWHDNVPVIGWLALRGKCRACKTSISIRYPLVEALTGVLFALVICLTVLAPGAVDQWQAWLLAVTHWVFISLMIAAAFIDADLTVIPEEINWGGTAVILLLALANPIHGGVSGLRADGTTASPDSATNDLPADIPMATPITSMSVSDFRRDPSNQDLDKLMNSWKRLIVPREGGGEITFSVTRPGGGTVILRPENSDVDSGQPIPGMPPFIRVSETEIYEVRYQRAAQAYVLSAVGNSASVAGGAEFARVANQWPITAWFGEDRASQGGFTPHLRSFLGALFGALIAGGVMWLLRATATGFLIKKALLHGQGAAMGMGDVKLLMLFGAMIGWGAALVSIFVGAAIALIVTVPMLLMKKQHLFPFGPFLATAAVVILLFHGQLMSWMMEFYQPVFQAFG